MTLKGWMLGKVNDTVKRDGGRDTRVAPSLREPDEAVREPSLREFDQGDIESGPPTYLGRYGALITAIRAELEHFVASELRLHLAIADRDRYVLTSIEVECATEGEHRELLRRFVREFKPEQIKQYLAREVIAGLRNASAIDLTQFAGLNAAQQERPQEEQHAYDALLAQLQSGTPEADARPYEVTLLGRWSEQHGPAASPMRAVPRGAPARNADEPQTPLADRTFTLDVHDADGTRAVELGAIVPGRRYSIGKDETCDVVVSGVYASRRHCAIWFDKGAWWVLDAGSTNGIRVEAAGALRRHDPATSAKPLEPIELSAGASLILSAHADGDATQYPRLSVRSAARSGPPARDAAPLATPIAPARRPLLAWSIAARMASGARETEIVERSLPFRIGRSRSQGLVVDWAHGDVSGRHVEIVAIDDTGASVVVHGENGVTVGGAHHPAGAQFHWNAGESMLLGRGDATSSGCTLLLSRASGG